MAGKQTNSGAEHSRSTTRAKPGGGKGRRRTPLQLERQERVFLLHLGIMPNGQYGERHSVRAIASIENISLETVLSDIRAEADRRAEERAALRERDMEIQLALVDDLRDKSMAARTLPGTGALGAAAKAIEMRAKLLGLDAPTRVDVGLQTLIDALDVT